MKKTALRGSLISASKTMEITVTADSLKSQGIDIVSLTAGQADFPTPDDIKEAGIEAIQSNFTRYTPSGGIKPLLEAVCDKYKNEFGVEYDTKNVVISNGAKHALFNAIFATCEVGDEVIIPIPSWVSYPEQVVLAGAKPVMVATSAENGYKLTPQDLKNNITNNTKLLILCSPSNPCGTVYDKNELSELVNIISQSGIYVIFDEIYEKLLYDNRQHCSLCQFEDIKDQVIIINGVSKSHAMTGWRIGYSIANYEIARISRNMQGHITSNPNSIAQKAALQALRGNKKTLEKMQKQFEERRNLGYEKLKELKDVTTIKPQGAFYFYPDFSAYLGKFYQNKKISTIDDLAKYFLEEHHVATIPGSAFGSEVNIRLSFACSQEEFSLGVERIKEALAQLK